MSGLIEAQVREYEKNMKQALDHPGGVMRKYCSNDGTLRGTSFRTSLLGNIRMKKKSERAEPNKTPRDNIDASARWSSLETYNVAVLIDSDEARTLCEDPASGIFKKCVLAGEQEIDTQIVKFALAPTVIQSKDFNASATVPFPVKNIVDIKQQCNSAGKLELAAAATPLNIGKLRRAKLMMDKMGVPRGKGERLFFLTTDGMDALLADTKVGSIDFNNVKALIDGEVDFFLGFTFVQVDVAYDAFNIKAAFVSGSTTVIPADTPVYFAMGKGMVSWKLGENLKARMTEESTQNYDTQVYNELALSGHRNEDGIVWIPCALA